MVTSTGAVVATDFKTYNYIIIETVCSYYRVSLKDLSSYIRTPNIVEARQLAMYFGSILLLGSDTEVALQFNRKRQLTIHSVKAIRRKTSFDYFDQHLKKLHSQLINTLIKAKHGD